MFSVGDGELNDKREVQAGDSFLHDACGQLHELKAAKNMDGTEDDSMLYFNCGEKTYLGAIDNKWLW